MVSVLIPVHNASIFLERSVKSILNQSYSDLEVLICDDASTDNSWEKLVSFKDPRIRLFRNPVNLGYLKTINSLSDKATGEFLAFQDADDYSHRERFAIQIDKFKINPSLFVIGTNYSLIDEKERVVRKYQVEGDPKVLADLVRTLNPFQKPSIMFRREVMEKVGMFREAFLTFGNISEDYDWILRASSFFQFSNVNYSESLYYYRAVPNAMTKGFQNEVQLLGHKVAQFLAEERELNGRDSIEKGDIENVLRFLENQKKPYLLDRSLFFHEKAAALIYSGLEWEAVKTAWEVILLEPDKIRNYRLLQYCFRKWIIQNRLL